ncbi:Nonribosomal peptide synthase (NRPS) [Penicillium ucsense]|uniref:Nonribosomal peptide synthase (NRPS) n=1 Tax=Penicillium ucsense TaxID=2839758 RepID=A0A8J8WD39_9EURO|nr:Nonribosomal peptide synthase (NRPS) [Penicillium ucsense]KAF7729384.1 Nonribosomal peptide synthase (NRPS) [Penicillium ucsense]
MATVIDMSVQEHQGKAVVTTVEPVLTDSSSATLSDDETLEDASASSLDNGPLAKDSLLPETFPGLPTSVYRPWASSHSLAQPVDLPRVADDVITTAFLGAWALLLGRYSSLATEVLFGIHKGSETKPQALRVAWQPETTIAGLLATVQEQLHKPEAKSPTSSLRTIVAIHTTPPHHSLHQHALILDIGLTSEVTAQVSARYDQNLLDPRQANRIVYQYSHLLRQLCGTHAATIDSLDLCCPEDRAEISSWTPTIPPPAQTTIHELVQQSCRDYWNELAVHAWDGDLTYGELDTAATKVAHYLKSNLQLGPGSCVPLTFDRSKFVPITQLAVLKAGAAYIGTEPSHPIARLQKIFDQVSAECILSSPNWVEKMTGAVDMVVPVDQALLDSLPDHLGDTPLPTVAHTETAVVIFTSGSTGTPKGIVMRHSDLASAIVAHSAGMQIPARTRVLQFSSFNFDHSIYEIMTALVGGCIVCIPTEEQRINDLTGVMRAMHVEFLYATPTVAKLLTPDEVPELKTLYLGGEAISQGLLELWLEQKRVIAGYGPTEAGMCGFSVFSPGDAASTIHVSQGGMNWVVDPNDHNKLVPIGTPGELLQEGPMVAAGYLNNPTATVQAFVAAPAFAPNSTARFYKSGDLAQYNPDGTFKFIARIDTQVKIRGQRVELEEIEDRLQPLVPADLASCVDVVRLQGTASDAIAGFLAPDMNNETADVKEIRLAASNDPAGWQRLTMRFAAQLAQSLPAYMVPTIYIPLSSKFPMTASGKLDRKQLRQFAATISLQQLALFRAPQAVLAISTPMEARLCELWQRVLGISGALEDAAANFFVLGGDSITAIRLVSACRAQGLGLTVKAILANPILSDMALSVEVLDSSSGFGPESFGLVDGNVEALCAYASQQCHAPDEAIRDIYPTSPLQQGLMAISAKSPGLYVVQKAYKLIGVDTNRLIQAWTTVAHCTAPCLNTRIFADEVGELWQVVVQQDLEFTTTSEELESYLHRDLAIPMLLGEPLARFAIVHDPVNGPVFVMTLHHAIHDAWSLDLLLRDFDLAYYGESLSPSPSFSGFITHLKHLDLDHVREGWQHQLESAPLTVFPIVPVGYIPKPNAFLEHHFELPSTMHQVDPSISAAIKIRAAWALLLATYVGADDVVFASTSNGRGASVPGIEEIRAATIATVPIRVKLEPDQSLRRLLQDLQGQAGTLLEIEQYGMQNIRSLGEDARVACDVQSLLLVEYDNTDTDTHLLQEVERRDGVAFHSFAFGLRCTITDQTAITVQVNWDGSLLTTMQVDRIMKQLQNAINLVFTVHPGTRILDLDLIGAADLDTIKQWNAIAPARVASVLHGRFEETACMHPDKAAVDSWDGQLTYRLLDRYSTRLAQHLRTLATAPLEGEPVLISFEKSMWVVVAIIAVMKAGGACVMLDPTVPHQRLHRVIQQVQARTLIASPQQTEALSSIAPTTQVILSADTMEEQFLIRDGLRDPLVGYGRPESLAFIVFTSGTTGEPKGIEISHEAACSSVEAISAIMKLDTTYRVVQFAPHAFDAFYGEVFAMLFRGGCICCITDEDRNNRLTESLCLMNVNCAFLTPTVGASLDPAELPQLAFLAMGGERMTEECTRKWGHRSLMNVYGPAETTIMCSAFRGITAQDDVANIGRAVPGARLWITKKGDFNSLAPIGTVGEILVEGPTLARGYLNDEARTCLAFVKRPRWTMDGPLSQLFEGRNRRFYRTGDMARYNPDGTLQIMGRNDLQVKIRGQRVELAEVQSHLQRHLPADVDIAVDATSTSADPNEPPTTIIVAFIVLHSADTTLPCRVATSTAARQELKRLTDGLDGKLALSLPSYMIPSIFLPVTCIPQTVTNKIDHMGLRRLVSELSRNELISFSRAGNSHSPPSTVAEKRMHKLWAQVLGLSPNEIFVQDNFFRLGGDSISAMKLVTRAAASHWRFQVLDVFKTPILADLARAATDVEEMVEEVLQPFQLVQLTGESIESTLAQAIDVLGKSHEEIEDIYPSTPLQDALMALSAKEPGTYFGQMVIKLSKTMDLDQWRRAWMIIYNRTPMLRTSVFHNRSGRLMQAVVRPVENWTATSVTDLQDYLWRDKRAPIAVGEPLVRYALVEDPTGRGNPHFVLSMHRAAYDAWSLLRMVEDLEKVFAGTFLDHVVGFNTFVQSFLHTDQRPLEQYWKRQMEDAPTMAFPRLPDISYRPAANSHYTTRIPIVARQCEYTIPTFIRAAWALLLARYADDTDDVVFGASLNGRSAPVQGIQAVFGPTTAVVPVRVKVNRQTQTVEDFLRQIHEQAQEMMAHEQYGIYNIGRLSPQIKAACDFQTLLMIQTEAENAPDTTQGALDMQVVSNSFAGPFHTFSMSLDVVIGAEELQVTVEYDSKLLAGEEIERLSAQLHQAFVSLHDPAMAQTNLSDLDLVSSGDIAQLSLWNQPPPAPQDDLVHSTFRRRAALQPGAPAVRSWEGELTYAELDAQSSALVPELLARGLQPGVKVPLLFEKSIYTVVTMLAVLKAGGACVSLDPAHPLERLRGLVEDVDAHLVLSSRKWCDKARVLIESTFTVDAEAITQALSNHSRVAESTLPFETVKSTDPAFILFTSGSTGKPKGIFISHSAFTSSIVGHGQVLRYGGPGSNNLQFTAYTSDVSIGEIFTSLSLGACVCIPSDAERMNGLAAAMERMHVNWAFLTPSVASLLHPSEIATLKTLLFGGETATVENVQTWAPAVYLINSFGPAECSIWTHCNPGIPSTASGHNIGFALGCNTWITDPTDHNKLAPIGTIGELIVEGPNVADGYINEPVKTAAAFIEPPAWFSRVAGKRSAGKLYKMGDLVRYLPNGQVHYVGRRDTQVKLRGQRVELGEIEHQMRETMLEIAEVAVEMVRPANGTAPPMLMAFLSVATKVEYSKAGEFLPEIASSEGELSRYYEAMKGVNEQLPDRLPMHMIPSAYVPLRLMPFTASAKTDRGKLQRLARTMTLEEISQFSLEAHSKRKTAAPPATDMERLLHGFWSQVLNLSPDSFGSDAHFFRISGDSIMAMRLVALARTANLDLTVETIFMHPVLSAMALATTQLRAGNTSVLAPFALISDIGVLRREASTICQIPDSAIEDIYPTTALQEGLLALAQKENGSYMAQFAFEIPDRVDMPRLRAAWETVYQQVPILRTRLFPSAQHGTMQVVVQGQLRWRGGNNKAAYLDEDRRIGMRMGQPLSRFAIVEDRILVFTAHHAIYDGWSVQPIYRRVEEIYHGLNAKPPVHLNTFIQYLRSIDQAASDEFWKLQLDRAPPSVYPASIVSRHHQYQDAYLHLDAPFTKRVGTGITRATLVRTALALVLGRYSDLDDVVYGQTTSGRAAAVHAIHDIAGPTLATTPLRITFQPEMQVQTLLENVQRQSLAITRFEQVGLQNIRRLSDDARAACNFQTLLVIQNPEDDVNRNHATFLGCPTANKDFFKPFHTYPLVLQCTFNPTGYALDLNYDAALVSESQVRRLLQQFSYVVEQLDSAPGDRKVRSLDMMVADDYADIQLFNQISVEPVERCLHELVEEVASQQPNTDAVVSWDGVLSYADLDRLSSRLARRLHAEFNIIPGSIIPICFEKSLWAIISMLGIMKAGAAYCPLDPHHPTERLREILSDVEAPVVLTSASNEALFAQFTAPALVVSQSLFDGANEAAAISVYLTSSHPAYCFFTSGSSGKPKGVITSHRAISTSVAHHGPFGFDRKPRILQFTAFTFDISVVEIFSTLVHGGCICIPSEYQRLSEIVPVINDFKVNLAILTPSIARVLSPEQLPHLDQLILGGEPIRKDLIARWAGRVRLVNGYGVTEAAVCNMVCDISSPDFSERTIGTALASTSWIVDPTDHHRLVPVGLSGELVIEGPIIADGYLKDPEKTAAAFIENPHFLSRFPNTKAGSASRRIYKTGDLVRYKPNGWIDFIGRKDTQVKLNGLRIELGEIEYRARVALGPASELAVEIVAPGGRDDNQTIALFLAPGNNKPENSQHSSVLRTLDHDLRQTLPAYMIPTICYFLDKMPLLVSGKVDRRALRVVALDGTPVSIQSQSAVEALQPVESEAEIALQTMWAQLLSVDPDTIGRNSSFFRSGGDSLVAVRLVSMAREQNIQLSVAAIFDHPTLADMAHTMATATGGLVHEPPPFSLIDREPVSDLLQEAARQCNVAIHDIEDMYPTTPLQEGMMVASIQDQGTYSAHFAYRLAPFLDIRKFCLAWKLVMQRASVTRMRMIHTTASGFVQVILRRPIEIELVTSNDIEQYKRDQAHRVMDLGQPLYRMAILGEGGDGGASRYFVLTMHHGAYDGWSVTNLWRNVQEAYYDMNQSPMLGSNHLIRYLREQGEADTLAFWKTYLEPAAPPSFPPLPSVGYRSVADAELTSKIRFSMPSQGDHTVATILQGAWGMLLSLYEGSQNVTFGVVVSGRTTPIPSIENMVGSTIANFPFRVAYERDQTVAEYLAMIKKSTTELIPHQQAGFQNIRKVSPEARAASALRTLLVFQAMGSSSLDLDLGMGVEPLPVTVAGLYTFPITMTCSQESTGISVNVSYDSTLVSTEGIHRMLSQFEHILDRLSNLPATAPNTLLNDIDLIGPGDMHQLAKWHALDQVQPNERTIHSMVHDQALQRPDAPAVCSWDGTLTYEELDTYSDRLAQQLVSLGVQPEHYVGFSFHKSIYSLVAILAIFKAGGIWTPLNPDHPQPRLASLLGRVSASVLITTPELTHLFAETGCNIITVTRESVQALAPLSPTYQTPTVLSTNGAYIMFTSGSTGEPKGVVVEHRNACSGLPAQAAVQGKTSTSRYLQFAAFTWDFCVGEIFANLISGGCVCMPSEHDRLNDLAGAMERLGINQASLTPTVASLLSPNAIKLETLSLGGEALTQELINTWANNSDLHYGDSPANIGRGLNCSIWIADSENHNRLMPVGAVGEIIVDGPVVARGYLHDPLATNKAFLEAPAWALKDNSTPRRLYATGDLGRFEPDGRIHILGRRDAQVKLNGQRVDLGEIDFQLHQLIGGSVSPACEAVKLENRGRPVLIAFVPMATTTPGTPSAPAEEPLALLHSEDARARLDSLVNGVHRGLAKMLPDFMIPHIFVPVNHIPTSSNLKIDHKALHALCAGLSMTSLTKLAVTPGSGRMQEPATGQGQALRGLWAQVLDLSESDISGQDNFSAIGGDSMGAVKLVSLARSHGFALTADKILQNQVLDDMAAVMEPITADDTAVIPAFSLMPQEKLVEEVLKEAATLCGILPESVEDMYPATPAQIGFLTVSLTRPGVTCLMTAFEAPLSVDLERLKSAWERTTNAHAVLRTRIVQMADGSWMQLVQKPAPTIWRSAASIPKYYEQELCDATGPGTPLSRAGYVIDQQTGKRYFITTACHSTYDAWAYALLFATLEREYLHGDASTSQAPEVPMSRFVRYLEKCDQEVQDEFWRAQLADYHAPPPLATPPTDASQCEANSICDLEVHLNADLVRRDISMPTAIYASWALALSQLLGAEDVTLLLTLSGRNAPVAEIERIIGPILTTVPLRIRIDPRKSLQTLLLAIESQCRTIIAHEQCSIPHIRTLSPSAQAACDLAFGLTVNPYNHHKADIGSGIGLIRPLRLPVANSPSPFFLDCAVSDCGVDAFALFDDRVVSRPLVKKFFAHFENNLRHAVEGSGDILVKDICMQPGLSGEDGQILHMVTQASGVGYDPVSKETINVYEAYQEGGVLEHGFRALDKRGRGRGPVKSQHGQYLK